MCCEWSNLTLKFSLKLAGKFFNGGLLLLISVWQITHIGTAGVVN
jgi:hypothetical protein